MGDLVELAFGAVLLVARVGACGMLLPGLGEADVPTPVRLGIVLCLVPLLLPGLAPELPRAPDSAVEALRLVAIEVAIGIWLGWLARLVTLALVMAGHLAGTFLGLSSLLVPDPTFGAQGSALGRAFGIGGAALALSTGLYAIPLAALAESYRVIPPGGAFAAGIAADTLVTAGSASLALALQLVAPLLLLSLLTQAAIGLLSRVAPQAQVFVLAAPAQTVGGIVLLAVLLPALLALWAEAAGAAWRALPGLG
jgi:flagellar biosynthetic protein FliR